jgi:3-methylcrotonyl-CoA carboxylase alpha subunit
LKRLLERPEFGATDFDTGFIGRHLDELSNASGPRPEVLQAAAMMVVDRTLGGKADDIRATYLSRDRTGWGWLEGFRLNAGRAETVVKLVESGVNYVVRFEEPSVGTLPWVERVPEGYLVDDNGRTYLFTEAASRGTGTSHGVHDGEIVAPMPGRVAAVEIKKGGKVAKGQRLLTLEAMKMEHALTAPFDGIVAELNAAVGAQVGEGQLLVRVAPEPGG